jgi:hypothetical protein
MRRSLAGGAEVQDSRVQRSAFRVQGSEVQDYHTNALGLRLEVRGEKLKDKDQKI